MDVGVQRASWLSTQYCFVKELFLLLRIRFIRVKLVGLDVFEEKVRAVNDEVQLLVEVINFLGICRDKRSVYFYF